MNTYAKLALAALLAAASASPVLAQHAHGDAAAQSTAQAQMTEGEIRKVDKEAGKLTIKHGELKNLGMPAMTMVFRAQEPAMLDQVKPGDKVSFIADKIGGQLTVTRIQVKN